ncbi:ABATE domain-containing protein [Actinoplanes sp. NPDC048796]|uniref:CGNR zinc finger domain-containing protein n=1 Tax=Actinoplanes sp. NPDC048796 TaxID=3155640 RepID=UPI0033DC1CB5
MSAFLEPFGGAVCLDFANTLDGRATAQPAEYLHTYADLAGWSAFAGLIDGATSARLRRHDAEASLRAALGLREAIFEVFAAIGRGLEPPAGPLDEVRRRYAEAVASARLVPGTSSGGKFIWEFTGHEPDRAWWPISVDAVRLLTEGPLDRVKTCAAEAGCIGLFVDTSKNRSRRWCTMDGCGVEAKVQRQARRRAARG